MKKQSITINFLRLLSIILLFYIAGNNSLFLYASTLSLYNIYLSCFSHITLKETFKKINYDYSKFKIFKYIYLFIIVISSLFVLLSIFISDAINIFLNIDNTFLPYLLMGISVLSEPLIKISTEYLESYNKPKLSKNLLNLYYILEIFFLIIISLITIKLIKLPINIAISLFYISKILSFIIISTIIYLTLKKQKLNLNKTREETKINYKREVKDILRTNSTASIITLGTNSYYYISIIILYAVLSKRYRYNIETIETSLTFIYLYGFYLMNFIANLILLLTKKSANCEKVINFIYKVFQNMLTTAIIIGITSPLICKIIYSSSDNSIYLVMLSFLAIFSSLFMTTFDYIKNKKIIYISIFVGIISKLILTIPLINSFYRIGHNLIYGDILSTIISMFISIVINYIYLKLRNPETKTFENILITLYESIVLCIILMLLQFIVPIKTDNYLKSLITLILYITISISFIKINNKKKVIKI